MRSIIRPLCVFFLIAAAGAAQAQSTAWPAKPVRLVVANTPGSAPDVLARQLAPRLAESWSQPVVVDNRAGAAGVLAADGIAKAASDGHNLLVGADGPLTILPNSGAVLPYDAQRDLVPVASLGRIDFVLVAHPSTGWKTVDDLVRSAKARPGLYNYASAGNGSPQQMAMELLKQDTGIYVTHIPYRGGPLGLQDVIAGQVQTMFIAIGPALQHIRTGRLVALATGGATRHALLPDVPTLAETRQGFRAGTWFGLFAPAGTPQPVQDKLAADVAALVAQPQVRSELAAQGIAAAPETQAAFKQQVAAEYARYGSVARRIQLNAP